MKLVFAILMLTLGFFLTFFGVLFKLESWPNATEMLLLGQFLGLVGLILVVLIAKKKRTGNL